MIVISDTTPFNYLLLVDAIGILPALYGHIAIPEAVRNELCAPGASQLVRAWASHLPNWVTVHSVCESDARFRLDRGESQAISLALDLHADLVLLDDRAARTAASELGLTVTGTLGVLAVAGARGLLDLPTAIERLKDTSFQAKPELYTAVLERASRKAS